LLSTVGSPIGNAVGSGGSGLAESISPTPDLLLLIRQSIFSLSSLFLILINITLYYFNLIYYSCLYVSI
jgi:hypothetical protein